MQGPGPQLRRSPAKLTRHHRTLAAGHLDHPPVFNKVTARWEIASPYTWPPDDGVQDHEAGPKVIDQYPKRPGQEGSDLGVRAEPPVGIEPTTCSLRVNRSAD